METSVKITLIIISAVIVLGVIGAIVFMNIRQETTINAEGIATVKAVPDISSIFISVQTSGNTTKEANDENAEIVDNIITDLVKLGLERKQITTEGFNIFPDYSWEDGKRELKGYKAVHTIVVKVPASDTSRIGNVIDIAANRGAGISYINFELSQELQNQYKAEALEKATEDARIKAESIARGLGKDLGKIVSVSSQEFNYYPWPVYRAEVAGADSIQEAKISATNIQPGEQEIRGRVSVVYALK